jgi:hypothetical protein
MTIRCLSLVACVGGAALLVGCGEAPESSPPALTGDQAKAALIDLLRSTDLDSMHGFPLDQFANQSVESHPDGSASWADFRFELKARKYSYTVERGERNTKSHFAAEYEGAFEFIQGKWVASKPRVNWIT